MSQTWWTPRCAVALVLAIAPFLYSPAGAQEWPSRPIRMVVHFPAGGITDVGARALGERLAVILGQPVVIDNRPGAGGQTGTEHVARSAPDGYTLLFATDGPLSYAPITNPKLGYDPLRDLEPVAPFASYSQQVVVTPGLPVSSIAELIAFAKKNPGTLNYATPGTASSTHFGMELFNTMAGIDVVHVPYKGSAQALTDLVAGNVHFAFDGAARSYIDSKRVRLIATTGERRDPRFPESPTVAEGGVPGYRFVAWQLVLAPKGTPPQVIARLNEAVNKIASEPEVIGKLIEHGLAVAGGSPQDVTKLIASGLEENRRIAVDAKLQFQ